jgi:hypothetical protein
MAAVRAVPHNWILAKSDVHSSNAVAAGTAGAIAFLAWALDKSLKVTAELTTRNGLEFLRWLTVKAWFCVIGFPLTPHGAREGAHLFTTGRTMVVVNVAMMTCLIVILITGHDEEDFNSCGWYSQHAVVWLNFWIVGHSERYCSHHLFTTGQI